MRLHTCTASSSIETPAFAILGGGSSQPITREQSFERTGSGIKSPRARSNGLLGALDRRVRGAMVKGLVAALLIGGATGCATKAAAQQWPMTPVAVQQTQTQAQYDTLSAKLAESLEATRAHLHHTWRDTPLYNADGTVNGFVEISMSTLTKHEFDIEKNQLEVDRVLPASLVGYPINYGFFPQTISYDGDPYDVLVLGPALASGTKVKGKIVAIMYMDDEKGADMKTVISPVDETGKALYDLTDADKKRIGDWFSNYKKWEAHKGKWSKVTGWGGATEGKRFIDTTHRFFEEGIDKAPEIKKLRDQAGLHRPLKVLMLGFEPWTRARDKNMSAEVVRDLQTKTSLTGVTLDTLVLPVEFEASARLAMARMADFRPDLVIALGESAGLKKLEIETYAENKDHDGKILDGGPDKIFTRFDLTALGRRTDHATDALDVVVNGSPGVFVCNDLFYRLLASHGNHGPEIVFAHLPSFGDRTLADVGDAVHAMLKSAVGVMRGTPEDEPAPLVG